jgi:hypothetical protein
MAADAGTLSAAPRSRRAFAPGLSIGLSTLYLSLIVLLPLAALSWRAHGWDAVSTSQGVSALRLTLGLSLIVALVNAVAGTAIAWSLVRDRFVGQGFVNALVNLAKSLEKQERLDEAREAFQDGLEVEVGAFVPGLRRDAKQATLRAAKTAKVAKEFTNSAGVVVLRCNLRPLRFIPLLSCVINLKLHKIFQSVIRDITDSHHHAPIDKDRGSLTHVQGLSQFK